MRRFLLSILLAISFNAVGQKTLQYRFSVGDNFTVQQDAKQYITQDLNGTDQIIENDMVGVMNFEVIDSTFENYTLSMSFKSLKMLMSSPTLGVLLNTDTESDEDDDITNILFKGILNIPVTIIIEKSGKITSVTGGDKLISSMFESAGIDQPEIIAASKEQFEKQFGSEALTNSFEQMTHFYPTTEVSVGSEWKNSYSGNMSANNNWKLDAHTSDTLTISGTSTTTMSNTDDNISMTLTGNQKTTVEANPKSGLFTQITVVGENSGDTLFKAQNMKVATTIKSTIIYKTIK